MAHQAEKVVTTQPSVLPVVQHPDFSIPDIVHVAPRPNDPYSLEVANAVVHQLLEAGVHTTDDPLDAQMVIAIGGDGTILYWAARLVGFPIPICGINTGHVGFLTATDVPEKAVTAIVSGAYTVEPRRRIDVVAAGTRASALNEISLVTARPGRAVRARVDIDSQPLFAFTGDGVVVATPTGSTGYALSAGGPLVSPLIDTMVLAALTPSTFVPGPFALPPSAEVQIYPDADRPMLVMADSQQIATIAGTSAVITLSDEHTYLVRTGTWTHNIATRFALNGSQDDLKQIAPPSDAPARGSEAAP